MEELKKEIKICMEINENENENSTPMGYNKSSTKREVHGNRSLPQETRETFNKQHNITPKAMRKREAEEPQS